MQSQRSLESIEQEVYGSQHRDGLLDIFAGVGLLAIGISWLTDYAWAGAIVPALLVPLWKPFRSRITEPRAGRVEFGAERRLLERRKMAALFAGGVLTMLLAVAIFFQIDERPFAWADYIATQHGKHPAPPALKGQAFGVSQAIGKAARDAASQAKEKGE